VAGEAMKKSAATFTMLLQSFFVERLMKQRSASPHTLRSYRDTFKMLLQFLHHRLNKQPSCLELVDLEAPLIAEFLDDLEVSRKISAASRNLRLAAIRSFFRYAEFEAPEHADRIRRILSIPSKKSKRSEVHFLSQNEARAMLDAPNQQNWSGQRDHALILVALHTGLRLSELIGLVWSDIVLQQIGAHIRLVGKGRKERCVPITKQTATVLKSWKRNSRSGIADPVFPNARGGRLSADGVQYIIAKHLCIARQVCPSLAGKQVTPHTLRHSCAMELMQAGVDRAMIALWLGHESVETTQIYLHSNLKLKEEILSKAKITEGKPGRFRPDDQLLAFLEEL
jgi:site-specific recombinase XerD